MSLLAGCATTTDWCASNRPIRPRAEDVETMSSGTARQLLEHNRTGAKICGWKRKRRGREMIPASFIFARPFAFQCDPKSASSAAIGLLVHHDPAVPALATVASTVRRARAFRQNGSSSSSKQAPLPCIFSLLDLVEAAFTVPGRTSPWKESWLPLRSQGIGLLVPSVLDPARPRDFRLRRLRCHGLFVCGPLRLCFCRSRHSPRLFVIQSASMSCSRSTRA